MFSRQSRSEEAVLQVLLEAAILLSVSTVQRLGIFYKRRAICNIHDLFYTVYKMAAGRGYIDNKG